MGWRKEGRPRRKGSGKKGVRMEMLLLLQPSLEPELYVGKAAQWSLCSVQSPEYSTAGHSYHLFLRLGSPPQCSLHSAQWLCQKVIPVGLFLDI